MFKPFATKCKLLAIFSIIAVNFFLPANLSASGAAAPDVFNTDPRSLLVRKIQERYADEIAARQALLRTSCNAVALVDIAKERLEQGTFSPSDPDWSLIIRLVLSGYGYQGGVDETLGISEQDMELLSIGYALSSAYQAARGNVSPLDIADVYSRSGDLARFSGKIATLNQVAALVPEAVHVFAHETTTRFNSLSQLSTFNAWFAHERFWAAGGVLDPKTPGWLRTAFVAYHGTPIGFVTDLTTKLNQAIIAMPAVPTAQAVVDLVGLSQQILLTLSAGIPGGDGAFVRLNPSNAGEWEIIRKALFLALSVTSDPAKGGRTFLSTLYDCGQFYHKKTDPDAVKAYYWRLEAFANGFSSLWTGLKEAQAEAAITTQLTEVTEKVDPLYGWVKTDPRPIIERGSSYAILRGAYQASIQAISIGGARGELAAALVLHPRLNHEEAFRTLYPDLNLWATYHQPSQRASALVTGATTKLNLRAGFQPQAINLSYADGKWSLKALRLDATGAPIEEIEMWRQGAAAAEIFAVDGPTATIKAISAGYLIKVGGAGSTTVVANGAALGVIESSAYPLHTDIFSNSGESSAISIEGAAYRGMRGILSAQRDSVWVKAPIVDLWYRNGFDVKTHNAKPYNFFSPKGQGIEAHKDVMLYGDDIRLSFSNVKAGQDVYLMWINVPTNYTDTHGSILEAGNAITINHGGWHAQTQTVFAGSPSDYEPPLHQTPAGLNELRANLTFNSSRAQFEYGRTLNYTFSYITILNDEERDVLLRGPHAYGTYNTLTNRMPTFTTYMLQPPPVERSSYGGGGYGGYGSGYGGGGRYVGGGSAWGVGSRSTSTYDRASVCAPASSMSYTGSSIAVSNRSGNTTVGGSVSFASMGGGMHLGSTSFGASYSTGESGRSLGLQSTFTPPSLMEAVRLGTLGIDPLAGNTALAMHTMASAAILQATAKDRFDAAAVVRLGRTLKDITAAAKVGAPSTTTGRISFAEAVIRDFKAAHGEDAADKGKQSADAPTAGTAAGAAVGGPNEDPEDEETKKSNFEKGDRIDLSRFSNRVAQSGEPARLVDSKSGEYIVKDLAGGRAHGGSYWKLCSKYGERIATFTEEGVFLRK
jgi:hypothetical protein